MNIVATISELAAEIALRQDVIHALQKLGPTPVALTPISLRPGRHLAPPPAVLEVSTRVKRINKPRKVKAAAAAEGGGPMAEAKNGSAIAIDSEPVTTAGGAMKQVIAKLKPGFSYADIEAALNANPIFAKLYAGASGSLLGVNLKYWSETGKLQRTGEGRDEARYELVGF